MTITVILMLLAACAAFAQPALSERNIDYAGGGRQDQMLDLEVPEGPGPFPLLIHVHGGGWRSGKKGQGGGIAMVRPRMLAQGYAFASINYRLSGAAKFPAQIQDCKAAVRWLRANAGQYRMDADRFAAWGTSAGGHLVALLGTAGDVAEFDDASLGNAGVSSRVQAVIDWYGPADFTSSPIRPGSALFQLLGCTNTECPALARQASPVTHASADDPPFLIMHGTNDGTVFPKHSQVMAEKLLDAGAPVALRYLPAAGHGGRLFTETEILRMMDDFLERVFRPEAPSTVSAADFNFIGAAPGEALSMFGHELSDRIEATPSSQLPDTLAGLTVEAVGVNEVLRRAGLYFASPSQVNFRLPLEIITGEVEVRLRNASRLVQTDRLHIRATAPTLFTVDGTGAHWAAGQAVYADRSVQPLARWDDSGGRFEPVAVELSANPGPAFLTLYGTGLGLATPSEVVAWIGDEKANVAYAGPQGQFSGLDQFNIEIPAAVAGQGDLSVVVAAAGVPANPVWVRIE